MRLVELHSSALVLRFDPPYSRLTSARVNVLGIMSILNDTDSKSLPDSANDLGLVSTGSKPGLLAPPVGFSWCDLPQWHYW